jgi:hypothetical protein
VRRAEPNTLVIADGTSCRHQIKDGTERSAIHVARALAMSLSGTQMLPGPHGEERVFARLEP